MKVTALLLAFTTLALAMDKDLLCHFHTTQKDCKAWTNAKHPTDDGLAFNITQQSKIANNYDPQWKAKAISQCVKIPLDPNVKALAMDTNGCTKGPKSAGEAELTQFNAIALFTKGSCVLGDHAYWDLLGTKKYPKTWVQRCWDRIGERSIGEYQSFALTLLDDDTVAKSDR